MRQRLIECALLVYAEKGVEVAVIDDVISMAGVSRGTFYRYFPSGEELLEAIHTELADEIMAAIRPRYDPIADPAARIACGLRLFITMTTRYSVSSRFIRSAGQSTFTPAGLIHRYLPDHLAEGISAGRFADAPLPVLLDLVNGGMFATNTRWIETKDIPDHAHHAVAAIMRGLGVAPDEAWRLSSDPPDVPDLAQDSLLARAQVRYLKSLAATAC